MTNEQRRINELLNTTPTQAQKPKNDNGAFIGITIAIFALALLFSQSFYTAFVAILCWFALVVSWYFIGNNVRV